MRYRCVKELKAEAATIPVGTVIDVTNGTDFAGNAYVTFATGGYHFAVRADAFREHFEEVGS